MQQEIFSTPNLDVKEGSVEDLITSNMDFSCDLSAGPETKYRYNLQFVFYE